MNSHDEEKPERRWRQEYRKDQVSYNFLKVLNMTKKKMRKGLRRHKSKVTKAATGHGTHRGGPRYFW
jgi:hypothetical protein